MIYSLKTSEKKGPTTSYLLSANKNLFNKNFVYSKKTVPNTTKNKNSLKLHLKTSSFRSVINKSNAALIHKSSKPTFINPSSNRSNNTRSKSPPLLEKFSTENIFSSFRMKVQQKSPLRKKTIRNINEMVNKEGIKLFDEKKNNHVKMLSRRESSNLHKKVNEEFSTFIRANNQNILEKMQSYSVANNILMKEVIIKKFLGVFK